MATIESLGTSVTKMSRQDLFTLLGAIRTRRRTRPAAKQKSTPAKVSRSPNKKNLQSKDMFQYANGLTSEAKSNLANELLKELLNGSK